MGRITERAQVTVVIAEDKFIRISGTTGSCPMGTRGSFPGGKAAGA
jgi:hypothetical protein